jgi:hypothetical protein
MTELKRIIEVLQELEAMLDPSRDTVVLLSIAGDIVTIRAEDISIKQPEVLTKAIDLINFPASD